MELARLRALAGLNESSDERKTTPNLTVKAAGKDPMSVKHAAGADPRDAAPANLTVKPAGKDPMSVKHAAGADPRSAAPKNLTVRKGGDKSMKEAEAAEHDALVEAIVATLNSIEKVEGLKAIAASIVKAVA
jgi:hypothetical protein